MKITIEGIVDSVQEREKQNGEKEYQIFLNQPGEPIKPKVKVTDKSLIPPLGEKVQFYGTFVHGVYNNRPYAFVKV